MYTLREINPVDDDPILATAPSLPEILGGFCWWDCRLWRIQLEGVDIVIVDYGNDPNLDGKRGYRIFGTNPRPYNDEDGGQESVYVEGIENAIAAVCNYLYQFDTERRFNHVSDLPALRVKPV